MPKDGRTTYAALRRHQGDDIYRVSAALGHSSIEVTERNYLNTPHYTKAELPLGQTMEAAIRKARRKVGQPSRVVALRRVGTVD